MSVDLFFPLYKFRKYYLIEGYNLLFLLDIIGVVSILLMKKNLKSKKKEEEMLLQ